MKGYIRQKYKVYISQRRISTALQMEAPQYHQRRQTNFGPKHVTAIDGHSRFVLCGVTMSVKNNQKIHEKVYRYIYHIILWFQKHISKKIII